MIHQHNSNTKKIISDEMIDINEPLFKAALSNYMNKNYIYQFNLNIQVLDKHDNETENTPSVIIIKLISRGINKTEFNLCHEKLQTKTQSKLVANINKLKCHDPKYNINRLLFCISLTYIINYDIIAMINSIDTIIDRIKKGDPSPIIINVTDLLEYWRISGYKKKLIEELITQQNDLDIDIKGCFPPILYNFGIGEPFLKYDNHPYDQKSVEFEYLFNWIGYSQHRMEWFKDKTHQSQIGRPRDITIEILKKFVKVRDENPKIKSIIKIAEKVVEDLELPIAPDSIRGFIRQHKKYLPQKYSGLKDSKVLKQISENDIDELWSNC